MDYCLAFALCSNVAVGTMRHPVLGDVPVCERCARTLGAVVNPPAVEVDAP